MHISTDCTEISPSSAGTAENGQPQTMTNAFLKKIENHALSVALHYMNYNFCRIHKTLPVTPVMAAGVNDLAE
jgi:hypothetical protein